VRATYLLCCIFTVTNTTHSYPIIYIITACPFAFSFPRGLLISALQVIPLAAARYNTFAKGDNATPFYVIVFADGFYLSSGFLNVALYRYTRPYLLPHRMDSLDNQSFVLRSELGDSQTHLPSSDVVGNNHHAPGNDPAYEVSEFAQHQGGTPLTASPGRVHDELTGGDAANIDDDI
jgi:hypothetical protein